MHARQDNSFSILMYHRVAPRVPGVARPTWNVTPERFRRQLEGLLSRGYRAWPLRRVLASRQAGEPVPARTFVVTFDDGYDGIHRYAWPILKALSVPATVFVVTSCLDSDRPLDCDDWAAAGSADAPAATWKPLSIVHCAEMMDDGLVEVGSHTHIHADFRGAPDAFSGDLARSLGVLRDALGVEQASFAFPFGHYDADMVAVARDAGVLCSLTTEPSLVSPQADPFSWGRFTVVQSDTASTLVMKLSGWYTVWRRACRCVGWPYRAARASFGPQNARRQPTANQATKSNEAVAP